MSTHEGRSLPLLHVPGCNEKCNEDGHYLNGGACSTEPAPLLVVSTMRWQEDEDLFHREREGSWEDVKFPACPNDHEPGQKIECWAPGGPCPEGQTECESCGTCQHCAVRRD